VVTPVHQTADILSTQAATVIHQVTSSIRAFLYYAIIVLVILWLVSFVSCLFYALFYFLYVPKIIHSKPVYFQFE